MNILRMIKVERSSQFSIYFEIRSERSVDGVDMEVRERTETVYRVSAPANGVRSCHPWVRKVSREQGKQGTVRSWPVPLIKLKPNGTIPPLKILQCLPLPSK